MRLQGLVPQDISKWNFKKHEYESYQIPSDWLVRERKFKY